MHEFCPCIESGYKGRGGPAFQNAVTSLLQMWSVVQPLQTSSCIVIQSTHQFCASRFLTAQLSLQGYSTDRLHPCFRCAAALECQCQPGGRGAAQQLKSLAALPNDDALTSRQCVRPQSVLISAQADAHSTHPKHTHPPAGSTRCPPLRAPVQPALQEQHVAQRCPKHVAPCAAQPWQARRCAMRTWTRQRRLRCLRLHAPCQHYDVCTAQDWTQI